MIPCQPKRALISVSDKRLLTELGSALQEAGVEILATGNTGLNLQQAGIPVTEVSSYTGFPEILDGRVKTLHPKIHAGLLARGEQDGAVMAELAFEPIDLVIVNLYPFSQVIANPNCQFDQAIENIDIGGPAMIRAAAKNYAHRLVIVSPDDYSSLQNFLRQGKMPADWPFQLAKKAFAHTAAYDAAIANYLGTLNEAFLPSHFPDVLTCQFHKSSDLRYGENPHQQATVYVEKNPEPGSLAHARLLQGKQLSFNNLLDADAALQTVKSFDYELPACVIVKHANPCGLAIGETNLQAYHRAFSADPSSAFGGIIAFNQPLDAETAQTILQRQFVEVLIAPEIMVEALPFLSQKPNVRVLETGYWQGEHAGKMALRQIDGGLLVQEQDIDCLDEADLRVMTHRQPAAEQLADLKFAWSAVRHVKSNAIVLAQQLATIGIGAGQTSRVMSTRIAIWQARQAGFKLEQAVLASDAFIPFPDTVELAAEAGIQAIIQPGGSVKDPEIIALADKYGLCMIFTGIRHFRH